MVPLFASAALACSTFVLGLPERPIVAYSFDFAATGAGFVIVNPEGATRRSIMEGAPAEWSTRFANVTFNQMGPGMPAAGMNAAGLVVSLMWNDDAAYGQQGNRPVVNELEFIQRLLDMSRSVEDALEIMHDVRISGMVPIHYLLADRFGNTATVMPTTDGLMIHTGDAMPVAALTNTSYSVLLQGLTEFEGFGGEKAVPSGKRIVDPNSLERFVMGALASDRIGSSPTTKEAFDVLDEVANSETRWQVVFDPLEQQISFRLVGQGDIHRIDLLLLDFSCRDRPLAFELNSASSDGSHLGLSPIDPVRAKRVAVDVLNSFTNTAGLGPQIADGLIEGLLEAVQCGP